MGKYLIFGIGKRKKGFNSDKSGTRRYYSPEMLKNRMFETQKADIWPLGRVEFFVCNGYWNVSISKFKRRSNSKNNSTK
jgi:hypothetical protein